MLRTTSFMGSYLVGAALCSNGAASGKSMDSYRCANEGRADDRIELSWDDIAPVTIRYLGPGAEGLGLSGESVDFYYVSDSQILLYLFPYGPETPVFMSVLARANDTYAGNLFLGSKNIRLECTKSTVPAL